MDLFNDDNFFSAGHPANRPLSGDSSSGSRTNLEIEVRALRSQVDRLTLASQALWEMIRDQGNFSEKELEEKISEIDLRDGSKDGRLGSTVLVCKSCGRKSNSRRSNCLWCGVETDREHIFEG
ncbi:MAG: hypothetical protein HKN23_08075 [Verrucomicrobiales bacterium]|nr:hypothetical protein [Verrucomicrobiales bacterium]